jgi:hypothetical protein
MQAIIERSNKIEKAVLELKRQEFGDPTIEPLDSVTLIGADIIVCQNESGRYKSYVEEFNLPGILTKPCLCAGEKKMMVEKVYPQMIKAAQKSLHHFDISSG